MRLYGAIEKVEPLYDGTVRVHGVASTEQIDDQGETVLASAMKEALPNYMRFPALREMHQLSAAGTTLEADVGDDGATRIVAHVVDPVAVAKVKNQVYRGFSIGGRVTRRQSDNNKIITGLALSEISLVDRPANPEAILDCWKAANMPELSTATAEPFTPVQIWACGVVGHQHTAKADAMKCLEKRAAAGAVDIPADNSGSVAESAGQPNPTDEPDRQQAIEKQATDGATAMQSAMDAALAAVEAGNAAVDELAQRRGITAEAESIPAEVAEAAKAGDAPSDGKKRHPIEKPSLVKSMWDIGEAAELCSRLRAMCERLELEAAIEGDNSGLPEQCAAACRACCELLQAMVAEETAEILDGTEIDEPIGAGMGEVMMSAIIDTLRKAITDQPRADALAEQIFKAGARLNAMDQMHLNLAGHLARNAMEMTGVTKGEMIHFAEVHKAVLDAGATNLNADGREMLTDGNPMQGAGAVTQHSTVDTSRNGETPVPNPTGASPPSPVPAGKASDTGRLYDALGKAAGKVGLSPEITANADTAIKAGAKPHHVMAGMIHDCLKAVSDGATCKADMPRPTRHAGATMAHLHKAHFHVGHCEGGKCMTEAAAANAVPGGAPTGAGEAEHQGTSDSAKAVIVEPDASADTLAKAATEARFDALGQALSGITALMTKMHERIEQIAQTPLPPQAMAMVPASMTKTGGTSGGLSPVDILTAYENLSEEDKVLAGIRKAQQNPVRIAQYSSAMEQKKMRGITTQR